MKKKSTQSTFTTSFWYLGHLEIICLKRLSRSFYRLGLRYIFSYRVCLHSPSHDQTHCLYFSDWSTYCRLGSCLRPSVFNIIIVETIHWTEIIVSTNLCLLEVTSVCANRYLICYIWNQKLWNPLNRISKIRLINRRMVKTKLGETQGEI